MVVLIVATLLVASSAHPTNRVSCTFPGAKLIGNGTARNQCLYFSNQKLNWNDAMEECKAKNNGSGTLASLLDPKAVLDYARKNVGNWHGFVGASDTANEGRYVWLNGQKLDYDNTPWYVYEPNGGTKENCLGLDADGDEYGYLDAPCNGISRFICDVGEYKLGVVGASDAINQDTCTFPGAELVGNQCLLFANQKENWDDSVVACKAMDGKLASLEDPRGVYEYAVKKGKNWKGWVGASDVENEGRYVWLDEVPLMYDDVPWHNKSATDNQQPDGGTRQNCLWLALDTRATLGYYDIECSRKGQILCDVGGVTK